MDVSKLRRRAEAGHWLLRLQEDQLAEAQVEAWLAWSADAENLAEFERLQALYIGLLRQSAAKPLDPGLRRGDGVRRRFVGLRTVARRRLLALAASLLLAVAVGFALWPPAPAPSAPAEQAYSTPKAVQREVNLPDGSHVVLGAYSKLAVDYGAQRRRVRIEAGEAYFEVRKDPRRPFVVEAGELAVTAVGTAFDVRRNEDRVVVTIAKGSVDVVRRTSLPQPSGEPARSRQPPTSVRAQAGERVTMEAAAPALTVASVSPAAADAWRYGRLEFAGEPLRAVVANLNRYLPNEIEIGDAAVGGWIYSGTVQPAHVDEWLDALMEVFPVHVVRRTDGSVVLLPTGPGLISPEARSNV